MDAAPAPDAQPDEVEGEHRGTVTAPRMPSDGEVIYPDARYGAADVGLEVVALGADGVEWLCSSGLQLEE